MLQPLGSFPARLSRELHDAFLDLADRYHAEERTVGGSRIQP